MTYFNLRNRPLPVAIFIFITFFAMSCEQPASVTDNTTSNNTAKTASTNDNPKPSKASENNQVVIEKYAFGPTLLTVSVGTKVTWINKDPMQHSVTSDAKTFDSGLLKQNQEFSRTFDKPGNYPYHCTPHPNMKAEIIVE